MIFSKAQDNTLRTNERNYYVTLVNIFVMAILSLFSRKNPEFSARHDLLREPIGSI